MDNGEGLTHLVYDYFIFSKIKALLGGKVRLMVTGSAPININVLNFLRICFCCDIMEGYGLSETSGIGSMTKIGDYDSNGVVGGPL